MIFVYLISFYIISFYIYKVVTTRRRNLKYSIPKNIKEKYKKISVPVNEINLLTNDYYEQNEIGGLVGVKVFDSLHDNNRNFPIKHKYISVLVHKSESRCFKSIPIYLSPFDIKSSLATISNVTIYIDENDLSKYFFDLSFLINR